MRIACVGGGPSGLYLAILMRLRDAAHEVTVYERNAADDTFGFGVVFSDETLEAFAAADPVSYAAIAAEFVSWGDIDVHLRGEVHTSGGHGFSALSRQRLLTILQRRAAELGVTLHFGAEAPLGGRAGRRPRPGGRRGRGEQRGPPGLSGGVPAEPRRPALPVHLARHRSAAGRVHVPDPGDAARAGAGARVPVRRRREHGDRGDARRRVAGGRAGRRRRRGQPGVVRGPARAVPRRAPADRQQLALDQLQHGPQRELATRQRRADRGRRPHRALLDRVRHEAGDGGRDRARRRARPGVRPRRCAEGVRGGAPGGRGEHPARRSGEPGVVRGARPVPRAGTAAVRVRAAHQVAPDHVREPAGAGRAVHRRAGRVVRRHGQRTGRGGHGAAPADVHPVPDRRPGAAEPGGRLADGHVLGARTG